MFKIALLISSLLVLALIAARLYWPTFTGTRGAEAVETLRDAPYSKPDPASWGRFLAEVVTPSGVDYTKAQGPIRKELETYLEEVVRATPVQFKTDNERLAFYLNAYNALVIQGVLNYLPIDSVSDVGVLHRFFRERVYTVAGRKVSLHGFEKKVIMNYNPLLHFGLNCASVGCPPLLREPFRAETLDAQLQEAARAFINDAGFNRYDAERATWHLSQIFEWYQDHFGGREAVLGLLRQYSGEQFPDDVTLTYIPYDWSLNRATSGPSS
ncbi:MAG: DUF547 domain-containing protein [Acidobacteriota bacterium]|nr:DUF547 domain-containing protein [Acidobacteriota bacterium]